MELAQTSPLTEIAIALISSLLAFVIAFIWQKGLIPFFENIVYKGIRIDGNWTVEQPNNTADGTTLSVSRKMSIELVQKASRLSGHATSFYDRNDGTRDTIFYSIEGEVKDRFVTLFLKCRKKNRMAYSTFLLEVVSDGHLMKGFRNFYGLKEQKINSVSCTLRKDIV
jgi:hypothetical protein